MFVWSTTCLLLTFVGLMSIASEPLRAQQLASVPEGIGAACSRVSGLTRSLALKRIVKVSALVAADGSVKTVEVKAYMQF